MIFAEQISYIFEEESGIVYFLDPITKIIDSWFAWSMIASDECLARLLPIKKSGIAVKD